MSYYINSLNIINKPVITPIIENFLICVEKYLNGRTVFDLITEENNIRFYASIEQDDLANYFLKTNRFWLDINSINSDTGKNILSKFLSVPENYSLFLKKFSDLKLGLEPQRENFVLKHIQDKQQAINFLQNYSNSYSIKKITNNLLLEILDNITVGSNDENKKIIHNFIKNHSQHLSSTEKKLLLREYLIKKFIHIKEFENYIKINNTIENICCKKHHYKSVSVFFNKVDIMNNYILLGEYHETSYEQMLKVAVEKISQVLNIKKVSFAKVDEENYLIVLLMNEKIKTDIEQLCGVALNKYVELHNSLVRVEMESVDKQLEEFLKSYVFQQDLEKQLGNKNKKSSKAKL